MAYRGFTFGFELTPWVQRLIIANFGVFVLTLVVPELNMLLAFVPSQVLLRPWTLLTYMFAHGGWGHVIMNMLFLFFFGPRLEARWGSREFLKYYLLCGLGGAALFFVVAGQGSSMIGASGAVFGIMLAFALNWPDDYIWIWFVLPVKVKYFVGVLAMVAFFSTIRPGSDGIAHAAHLGGVVAGLVYLRMSRPGGAFSGLKRMMNRRRLRIVQPDDTRRAVRTSPTAPPRRRGGEEEKLLNELDRVLEKISTQGMSSLTPQERKLLDEVSRRYRNN